MTKLTDDQVSAILKNAGGNSAMQGDVDISLDEIESFGDRASMLEAYKSMLAYSRMLKEQITFINKDLQAMCPFTRENLYLICAYTGSGKSTIAANITYPLWQEGRKTLVIANEESKEDVLMRIACLHLGYSFNDYKKGTMPETLKSNAMKLFPEIATCVKVIGVDYKDGFTTKIEAVKNALNAVTNSSEYSCVLIDYYQLIQYSVNDPSRGRYDVLNDLRIFLGQYIKKSGIPVVLFAQLHSFGKRSNPDLDSRIKECPSIMEPSTVIIEAVPDFENHVTDFRIAKDRFGNQGKRVQLGFDRGRFVSCDDAWKQKQSAMRLKQLEDIAYGTGANGGGAEPTDQPTDQSGDSSSDQQEPEQQQD